MESINILLVEDNEGDIFLVKEALEESKIINRVHVVKNGRDAVDYLFSKGKYNGQSIPDLIILDINIPMLNGHEVLKCIKEDERTKIIPVIMLTTSSSERDILKSYQHHANCFISKPVDAEEFVKAIRELEIFWFNIVKFPKIT